MRKLISHLLLILLLFPHPLFAADTGPAVVRTEKTPSGWVLKVNDQPFYIKGISCNDGLVDGVDYLQMAAEAGANTVRIYGDATETYLDLAQQHGLKVNVGFWTNAIRGKTKESYQNAKFTAALKTKALDYIRRFKNHPAVLVWTVGNEAFIFSEKEEERVAYGHFLEDLVQAIHREDPNHPVMYSSSYTRCLPYLKQYVPSIDWVGVNVTGGAGPAIAWAEKNDFDRPVVVTEFAPLGSWEMRKDPNNRPYDAFDHFKANDYNFSWRQIQGNSRSCIGGFAFVLGGFRNQDSLTWYNMNYHGLKRAGYWAVRELYTGLKPDNRPPKIVALTVNPINRLKPKQRTTLTTTASDPEGDALTYDYFITDIAHDPLVVEKPTFFPTDLQKLSPGSATLQVPRQRGIYRIYVGVKDGRGNIAIADRTIKVE